MFYLVNTIKNRKLKKKKINTIKRRFPTSLVQHNVKFDNETILDGDNFINSNSNICGTKIGYASYVNCSSNLQKCCVGKFCSIGSNVNIISSTHPITFCSTFPGFYNSESKTPFGIAERSFNEKIMADDIYSCYIGNDVWIGFGVTIKGGITIGDGAIIGMGSVVTKNVPPYAIVAGNPAKIIRYRFNENTIKKLLIAKWWDLDPTIIKNNRNIFFDVNKVLKFCQEENSKKYN